MNQTNKRALPDFVVIGAMRAGTTTLYNLLSNIEGLCMPRIKETNYFVEDNYLKYSPKWYYSLYNNKEHICGDISPNYSKNDLFKGVPKRIFENAPNTKIIYIVRERIDRVVSHYSHSIRHGHKLPEPKQLLNHTVGKQIISSSMYAYQIKGYLKYFDMNQILIVEFGDLINSTSDTVNNICSFLGVDTDTINANIIAAKIEHTKSNSRESLASLPKWFHTLKRKKSLSTINSFISNKRRQQIKGLLTLNYKHYDTTPVPYFDDETIKVIAEYLNHDVEEFERIRNEICLAHNSSRSG